MFKTFAILKVVSIANHQSHQITRQISHGPISAYMH